MVTRLKDDLRYIEYIRNKIKDNFPDWKEHEEAIYEGQINNNFQIGYIGSIEGYLDSIYKILFVKDRGLLEVKIDNKNDVEIDLGYVIYNGISINIPNQNKKWPLDLNVELIEYYTEFLSLYFKKR